jgi:amino acid transporter
MSTLSWQAGNASGSFLTGTIIQSLAALNYPNYNATSWQGTLLVFASVAILYIMNVYGSQLWSKVQNVLLFLHVAIFLVFIIVLAVRAPHQSAKVVFTEFTNEGGWATMGTALMVGQITAIYSLIGK